MRRSYCMLGIVLMAFGLGLCLGCLIASTFLRVLLGMAALGLGAVIYFS